MWSCNRAFGAGYLPPALPTIMLLILLPALTLVLPSACCGESWPITPARELHAQALGELAQAWQIARGQFPRPPSETIELGRWETVAQGRKLILRLLRHLEIRMWELPHPHLVAIFAHLRNTRLLLTQEGARQASDHYLRVMHLPEERLIEVLYDDMRNIRLLISDSPRLYTTRPLARLHLHAEMASRIAEQRPLGALHLSETFPLRIRQDQAIFEVLRFLRAVELRLPAQDIDRLSEIQAHLERGRRIMLDQWDKRQAPLYLAQCSREAAAIAAAIRDEMQTIREFLMKVP